MKKTIYSLLVFFLLLLLGYFAVSYLLPLHLPSLPSSTVFLDNKGQEIGEILYSGSIRHREITSQEIPDFYKKSLIALEDTTFWTNDGVSLRGIIRSTLHNIQAGKVVEGGTTLSSGLIRNIFWIGEDRTFGKKVLEFLYAIRLNHLYPKDQILTEYINRVGFGYLNYGLKSAAKHYFGREPNNLTKAEQIALLILPKDSKKYDPYKKPKSFQNRFEEVVGILAKDQIITEEERKDMLNENLSWNTDHSNPLPYVSDFLSSVIARNEMTWQSQENNRSRIATLPLQGQVGIGNIRTAFDLTLTEQIDTIAKNTLSELAWRNVSDYGILIAERGNTETSSGGDRHPFLRAMIGGADYMESLAGQVNATLALRQPGSAIKPFTYLLAFEKLGITPESTILDLPTAYRTSEDYAYEPKNYSQDYKGEITLRRALSESVNIPAVKLAEQVGVPVLLNLLRGLGIGSLTESADHYGLGLTLGNGEVSLFELLQAYTVFANDGKYCPFVIANETGGSTAISFSSATDPCKQITGKKYTDMVVSILTDRYAKLGGFPLYSALDFPDRNVFVKTGTSRNFRDNWAVGFTDHYMIGVWTGNKSGEDMKGVTGATGAGEIFRRIVYALEKKEQEQSPTKLQANGQSYLTITNPLEGSLYKEESEKNADKQKIRLHFETNIPYDSAQWMLDGVKIPDDFIGLTPGNHTIEIILMKDGQIVGKEKSTFQVESAR